MNSDFDRFLRQLKELVDAHTGRGYETNGPMRVYFSTRRDDKGKARPTAVIEAGWDSNYGGKVVVECSPTGKSIHVWHSPGVRVEQA